MSFTSTDLNSDSTEVTWFTPKEFIDNLGSKGFDLDPCTMSFRPFDIAQENIEHDNGGDGLTASWENKRCFINPPYGKHIRPFINKFIAEKPSGFMLIFARMGSPGVQDLLNAGAYCFLLRKRISFVDLTGTKRANAGVDSALFFFDKQEINNIKHEGILIRKENL